MCVGVCVDTLNRNPASSLLSSVWLRLVPFSVLSLCVPMTTGCHKDVALATHLRSGRRRRLVPPTPDFLRNSGRQTHRRTQRLCWMWSERRTSAVLKLRCMIKQVQHFESRKRIMSVWVGGEATCERGRWETPVYPVSSMFYFQFSCKAGDNRNCWWDLPACHLHTDCETQEILESVWVSCYYWKLSLRKDQHYARQRVNLVA